MEINEITEFAERINKPEFINQKVLVQVWQDGRITLKRKNTNPYCTKQGHPTNKVELPMKLIDGYTYVITDLENAFKLSEIIHEIKKEETKIGVTSSVG